MDDSSGRTTMTTPSNRYQAIVIDLLAQDMVNVAASSVSSVRVGPVPFFQGAYTAEEKLAACLVGKAASVDSAAVAAAAAAAIDRLVNPAALGVSTNMVGNNHTTWPLESLTGEEQAEALPQIAAITASTLRAYARAKTTTTTTTTTTNNSVEDLDAESAARLLNNCLLALRAVALAEFDGGPGPDVTKHGVSSSWANEEWVETPQGAGMAEGVRRVASALVAAVPAAAAAAGGGGGAQEDEDIREVLRWLHACSASVLLAAVVAGRMITSPPGEAMPYATRTYVPQRQDDDAPGVRAALLCGASPALVAATKMKVASKLPEAALWNQESYYPGDGVRAGHLEAAAFLAGVALVEGVARACEPPAAVHPCASSFAGSLAVSFTAGGSQWSYWGGVTQLAARACAAEASVATTKLTKEDHPVLWKLTASSFPEGGDEKDHRQVGSAFLAATHTSAEVLFASENQLRRIQNMVELVDPPPDDSPEDTLSRMQKVAGGKGNATTIWPGVVKVPEADVSPEVDKFFQSARDETLSFNPKRAWPGTLAAAFLARAD